MRTALAAALLLFPALARASFDPNSRRYAAPYDVLQTLKRLFPAAPGRVSRGCSELTESNRAVLGDDSPDTGRPAIAQPSGGFVRWYALCLKEYVDASAGGAAWPKDLPSSPWSALAKSRRDAILHGEIERLIGPEEVVVGFGAVKNDAELIDAIEGSFDGSEDAPAAVRKARIFLGLRDEFLSY